MIETLSSWKNSHKRQEAAPNSQEGGGGGVERVALPHAQNMLSRLCYLQNEETLLRKALIPRIKGNICCGLLKQNISANGRVLVLL